MVEYDKDYEFDIIIHDSYSIEDVTIYPHQGQSDSKNLIVDNQFYSSNQTYPENAVSVSDRMYARNMELVLISVTPYSYNAGTKTLEVFTNIEITVSDSDSESNRTERTIKRSKLFEQLYGDMIVNFEATSRQEDYQQPAILYLSLINI